MSEKSSQFLDQENTTDPSPNKINSSDSLKQISSIKSEQKQTEKLTPLNVIKVTRIKDGIYISDINIINNSNFMYTFKITHIINVSGENFVCNLGGLSFQIINISWEESPNQNLFDPEFIIPTEIENFIDDSINSGEGLLIYSKKGIDRACIIIIIYFMKKFNWSLQKCMEYLKVKKRDMLIPQYFIDQLKKFEEKLTNSEKSINWLGAEYNDQNEEIISNTFINCFLVKYLPIKVYKNNTKKNIHVDWDKSNKKEDYSDDLFFKTTFKEILSHKKIKPKKSCIKKNNDNGDFESINIVNEIDIDKNNISEVNSEYNSNEDIIKENDISVSYDFENKSNVIKEDKPEFINSLSFPHSLSNDNLFEFSNNDSLKNNGKLSKITRIKKSNKILSIKKHTIDYDEIAKMIKYQIDGGNNNIINNSEVPKYNRNMITKNNNTNNNKTNTCNNNINNNSNSNTKIINTQINNSIENKEKIYVNDNANNKQNKNVIFSNIFISSGESNNNIQKNNNNNYNELLSNNNQSVLNYENNKQNNFISQKIENKVNKPIVNDPQTNMNYYFPKNENINNDSTQKKLKSYNLNERKIDENDNNKLLQESNEFNEKNNTGSYNEKNINNNNYYNSNNNNLIINNQNNIQEIIKNNTNKDNNNNGNINYNITNINNTNFNNTNYNYNNTNYNNTNEIIHYSNNSQVKTEESKLKLPLPMEESKVSDLFNSQDKNNSSEIIQPPKIYNETTINGPLQNEIILPMEKITSSSQLISQEIPHTPNTLKKIEIPINLKISSNQKNKQIQNIINLSDIPKISNPIEITELDKTSNLPEIPISHRFHSLIRNPKISEMSQTIRVPQVNNKIEMSEVIHVPRTPQITKKIHIPNFDTKSRYSQISQVIPLPQTIQFSSNSHIIPEVQISEIYPISQNDEIQNQQTQNIYIPQTQNVDILSQIYHKQNIKQLSLRMNNVKENSNNSLRIGGIPENLNNNLNNIEINSNFTQAPLLQNIPNNNVNTYNNIIPLNHINTDYIVANSYKDFSDINKKSIRRSMSTETIRLNNPLVNNYNSYNVYNNLNLQSVRTNKNLNSVKSNSNIQNFNINNLVYYKNNNINNYPRYNNIVNNQSIRAINNNNNITRKLIGRNRARKRQLIYSKNYHNFAFSKNSLIYASNNNYLKTSNKFYGNRLTLGIPSRIGFPYMNQIGNFYFTANTFMLPQRNLLLRNWSHSNNLRFNNFNY